MTKNLSQKQQAMVDLFQKHVAPKWQGSGLENPSLTRAEKIAILVNNPVLIERPIVVSGNKAALGRPPEKVLGVL